MKKTSVQILFFLLAICLVALLSVGCNNTTDNKWYKGNLHMHSFWSDGDIYPEKAIEWYKTNKYNFVGLSDHNILAKNVRWKKIPDSNIQQKAFNEYIGKYGQDWVVFKKDNNDISVKLKTYDEYKTLFEESGKFLILQSEEITDKFESKPIHLNAINIQEYIEPQKGNSVVEVLQNNIDAVNIQGEKTGKPILTTINHPNFGYAFADKEMSQLENARFFEVYNAHPRVNNPGDSEHISTEKMWDLINIQYALNNKPLIFGLATDDTHNYLQYGKDYANPGRGWIMVKATELTPSAIINSMEKGDFYASSGVYLQDIQLNNNKLSIIIEPESGIQYSTFFYGIKSDDKIPVILKKVKGTNPRFKLKKNILFVRAKIISTKLKENSIYATEYEAAWTQPVEFQR